MGSRQPLGRCLQCTWTLYIVRVQCWIEVVRKGIHIWMISGEASSLSPLGVKLAVGFLGMPFIRLIRSTSSLCWLCLFVFCLLLGFFGGHTQHASFPGSKPCHIGNPSHSGDNVGSLTHWAIGELLLRAFYPEAPLDIVKWLFSFHWDNLLLFCPLFC